MTTPTTTHPPIVPLAIWPVAQTTAQWQRAGRYLPSCTQHPGKMLPELARRIVTEYSTPGALVVDPLAGIGTTAVEAALLARRAIGVELEDRWVTLAVENLDHMLAGEQRRQTEVRQGDARHLAEILGDLAGRVDLIVTSPPYACDAGVIDKPAWLAGGRLCPAETLNYSADRANLGHARGSAYADRHGGGVRGVPCGAPPRRPARRGHQEHPPQRPHSRSRRPHRDAGDRGWIHLPRNTSSPSTRPSATATSSPDPPTGRPPRSATPGAAASPPISWLMKTSPRSSASRPPTRR